MNVISGTNILIFKKMAAIKAEISPVAKNRANEQQKYMFRGIDDIYAAVQQTMAKHGVFSLPEVLEDRTEERQSRGGAVLIYRVLKIRYTFYAEDGSSVSATVIGEGMDSGDKASNKAMSVAEKYSLIQAFKIPTAEPKDPENDHHEVAPRPAAAAALPPEPHVSRVPPPLDLGGVKALAKPGEYIVEFGKNKGMKIKEIPSDELQSYARWLIKNSGDTGKPLSFTAKTYLANAEAYINLPQEEAPTMTDKDIFETVADIPF